MFRAVAHPPFVDYHRFWLHILFLRIILLQAISFMNGIAIIVGIRASIRIAEQLPTFSIDQPIRLRKPVKLVALRACLKIHILGDVFTRNYSELSADPIANIHKNVHMAI